MLKFIILGIVQGLTEFLPISSSAHLVIIQHLFGIDKNVVFLDVVLHLGTLCSLLFFLREDIFVLISSFLVALSDILLRRRIFYVWKYDSNFRLCIYILVSTALTGYLAINLRTYFEKLFYFIPLVIAALIVNGIILLSTKNLLYGQRDLRHITIRDAIIFGIVQVFALAPGISRSGLTISLLLFRNIKNESAFKFSFLVSIPIVAGAFVVSIKDFMGDTSSLPLVYLVVSFLLSFFTGIFSLFILRKILKQNSFYKFSFYSFCLAILVLLLKLKGFF